MLSVSAGSQKTPHTAEPFAAFTVADVAARIAIPTGSRDGAARQNVGCQTPDADLTPTSSEPFIIGGGQQYENMLITGRVTSAVSTDVASFVNCKIRPNWGTAPTSQYSIASGKNLNFGGTSFTNCTIDAGNKRSAWLNVFGGGGYTIDLCEVMGGVDGLHVDINGNVRVTRSRIYYGYYQAFWSDTAGSRRTTDYVDAGGCFWPIAAASDGQSSGDTHSDGLQLFRDGSIVVQGNYIGGQRSDTTLNSNMDPTDPTDWARIVKWAGDPSFINSAVIFNPVGDVALGVDFQYNVLHGGNARANLGTTAADTLSGVTFANNFFVRDSYGFDLYVKTGCTATISGNRFYDDLAAVTPTFY